jgi:hypothetical protein
MFRFSSTMTLGPSGGCYSELPSPTTPIPTGCAPEYGGQVLGTTTTTYVIGGTATSGKFYFPESPTAQLGTLVTETLSADELSEYNLITVQAPIYFVRPSNGVGRWRPVRLDLPCREEGSAENDLLR